MTKAENRAAANAWREYREQQRREAERAADIAADQFDLGRLRGYLIFGRRAHGADADKLRSAIDDYVEELTGNRTKLHAGSSSIG
ncbi:hypothetical protein [uncultured Bradyrhizobium sp.]|jgi:CHASE3 domain sensor protein|uniref:hypothetical protein n=1 Tax=uncultured Bradyrhizobium sp. TaxID=199684 RepID=UPI002623F04A|nr:hypothetical protein [uncultured Bradyrhizobium sp.]